MTVFQGSEDCHLEHPAPEVRFGQAASDDSLFEDVKTVIGNTGGIRADYLAAGNSAK